MNKDTMKCDNCKYGSVTRGVLGRKVLKVECAKFRHDLNITTYKNLRFCQWFEKR